jgi:AefR-like transcriptional repressor, C-terminal domain
MEAPRAPEVAETLDSIARAARRVALRSIMAQAKKLGLLKGSPPELARLFAALLFGDLHVNLLLGIEKPPNPREIEKRAHDAATAFLRLSA